MTRARRSHVPPKENRTRAKPQPRFCVVPVDSADRCFDDVKGYEMRVDREQVVAMKQIKPEQSTFVTVPTL